jgi:hypothetical protein
MLQVAAFLLLCVGVLLEVSALGFFGLDLLVGLCFLGALVAGATTALFSPSPRWGLLAAGLATFALVFHVWLNLA